jgi:predicted AlkP superfamily phosphohydrolase/phosphomutase
MGVGALLGLFWWHAYVPSAHAAWLLAALHGAAGAVLGLLAPATAFYISPRATPRRAITLAALGGLCVGPLIVAVPFETGWLNGLSGLLAFVVASGAAALLGVVLAEYGLVGAAGLVALLLFLGGVDAALSVDRERAGPIAARRIDDSFGGPPVAVIGIDGADWSVIGPLREQGALPVLSSLIDRGQHGILRSIEPTLSPVVWTTLFSGQPAQIHGLRDWATSDNRNRRVPMLWDIFAANDLTALSVNVPGSWPPSVFEGTRILSGFPIPGILSGRRGQLTGTFLSSVAGDEGDLPTLPATPDGEGGFRFSVEIAAPQVSPRWPGVSHALIDAATEDRLLKLRAERLEGRIRIMNGAALLGANLLDEPVRLPVGAWSPWLTFETGGGRLYARALVVEASPERLRLYLTPSFQDPAAPRYAFSQGFEDGTFPAEGAEPYVVEGLGWRAHRDDRIAAHLFSILADFERTHLRAALAELEREPPDLFAYVLTLTDRIQHPFWRDHEPAAYGSLGTPHPGLDGRDPVEEAYRLADRFLGQLLSAWPSDGFVFVVSDHGAAAHVAAGEGGHRDAGMWIATGPGIPATTAPHELSILDLVPTLLRCIGAPLAEDMLGHASARVCPDVGPLPPVASYRAEPGDEAPPTVQEKRIDATREAQLRSLGYIE